MNRRWMMAGLAGAVLVLGTTRTTAAADPPLDLAAPSPAPAAVAGDGAPEKSPVETFRELLAMSPAERKGWLGRHPVEVQRQIQAKLREYNALRPSERDVRLEVTELYYYLWPLMKTPATNRSAQLASVPERERAKVETRLREWDQLPAGKQQELLTNALAVRHFVGIQTQPPLPLMPPARQERLEQGIRQWQTLPPEQRRRITSRFNQFFYLTDAEKQKALNTLSEPERQQIQKALNRFAQLTPAEREDYLSSFDKFSQLSPAERQQFLKKAECWSALTPEERQEWRETVENSLRLPPLPPGPTPPLPTDAR